MEIRIHKHPYCILQISSTISLEDNYTFLHNKVLVNSNKLLCVMVVLIITSDQFSDSIAKQVFTSLTVIRKCAMISFCQQQQVSLVKVFIVSD